MVRFRLNVVLEVSLNLKQIVSDVRVETLFGCFSLIDWSDGFYHCTPLLIHSVCNLNFRTLSQR